MRQLHDLVFPAHRFRQLQRRSRREEAGSIRTLRSSRRINPNDILEASNPLLVASRLLRDIQKSRPRFDRLRNRVRIVRNDVLEYALLRCSRSRLLIEFGRSPQSFAANILRARWRHGNSLEFARSLGDDLAHLVYASLARAARFKVGDSQFLRNVVG